MQKEHRIYACDHCGHERRERFYVFTGEGLHDQWLDLGEMARREKAILEGRCPSCGERGFSFKRSVAL